MLQIDFNPSSLREAMLAFLWNQWSALGVAGTSGTRSDKIIDPEALLILTMGQARHDPRLFDEVVDWLVLNESRINIQRLTSLLELYNWGDTQALPAVVATIIDKRRSPRWKKLATTKEQNATAPLPLFFSADGVPHPIPSSPDPTFLRFGWARPVLQLRKLTTPISPGRSPTLIFTLRAFFGIQARAEIFAWLLCRESGRPADIARATGFRTRTIETTLNDMAESGQIIASRHGRDKHYHIAREKWLVLLPEGRTPVWFDWAPLFALLSKVFEILDAPKTIPVLRAAQLKRVFEEAASSISNSGLMPSFEASLSLPPPEFARMLLVDFEKILGPNFSEKRPL